MRITLRDVYRARRVVYRYLNRTPLAYSRMLSRMLGFDVYFKLENTNPTRAFKVRGGIYYMHVKGDEAVKRGVITASTGNHAQSIAYAGGLYGARVTIVMPHGVSRVKVEAVKALGADVVFHGGVYEEARLYAEKLAKETGALYVHGVNEPLLYAGVGTMHLENIEDLPDLDVIVNPIGGGSGASSAVIVAKSVDPGIRVIGVQAEGARSFYESWRSGKLVSTGEANTIAEGLATSMAYELPFSILAKRIDDIVLVTDKEMLASMKVLLDYLGQVVEPAGAAALAAASKIRDRLEDRKVVVMVTGGNADPKLVKTVSGMDVEEAFKILGIE
ncbi:MAG: pyridoxal-phosphate dependent enzyme [Desulfurococcales archaeon]|nr:pyridoxal-phosphate dependent enzyme [Desulfurococcales archaeon]